MCVIEIKAGMRHTTVAQAVAHNISTLERDMDFLRSYCLTHPHARVRIEMEVIENCQMHLHAAYRGMIGHWESVMGYSAEHLAPPDPLGTTESTARISAHPVD